MNDDFKKVLGYFLLALVGAGMCVWIGGLIYGLTTINE
jgi:hypothetical protein